MVKIKKEEKEECGGPMEGKKQLKPCKDTLRAQPHRKLKSSWIQNSKL